MSSEQEETQRLIREILKRERNREWDKTSFYLREVSPGFLQRLLDIYQGRGLHQRDFLREKIAFHLYLESSCLRLYSYPFSLLRDKNAFPLHKRRL